MRGVIYRIELDGHLLSRLQATAGIQQEKYKRVGLQYIADEWSEIEAALKAAFAHHGTVELEDGTPVHFVTTRD